MSDLETVCAAFGLDGEPPPVFVRHSLNEVWRGQRGGAAVYLRVTPASHRSFAEVQAELDWLRALHAAGLRVVQPLASSAGRLVEAIRWKGQPAAAVLLAAAPGRPARKQDDYTPAVVASWADLMADLHLQAREQPGGAAGARPRWDRDSVFQTALQASDAETQPAQRLLRRLTAWMQALPTSGDAFGLTHADLHLGNLNVDGVAVTAFDFDDCCQHWFIHDVAVAVTSIRKAAWEHPGRFDPLAIEAVFLDRYRARGVLPAAWLARLEPFVAYRIALSACWAARSLQTGELEGDMLGWFRRSLPWWLQQLSAGARVIEQAISAPPSSPPK